ncbi:MAG: hypothetical protein IJS90_01110 [Clostridia bacterium]|nr:hypothetical protein [Clostridia bacterium]
MKTLTSLCLIFSFFFASLRFGFVPTVVFDASSYEAKVTSNASGYLYGLAEENVPDALMADSLDIAVASQKVIGGLQHPIGDVDHVAGNLNKAKYIVVYLQDAFSTWYYENDKINGMRSAGTYDWREFIENEFFPEVRRTVSELKSRDYANRIVYCPYNECDNGVWFGTWQEKEGYSAFDEEGKKNFFEAWKLTNELIRSIDENAVIGGPGYYEYSSQKELDFLTFCKENGCVPDVMIYHELGELSSENWDVHVNEYRELENSLGISALPILVTEYGTMEECGNPARMFRYIYKIEETGAYGCIAYWRLANNLCDNCADGISPNSCWWLYRWYTDMEGFRMKKDVRDLFHSDFGKAVKEGRHLRNKHLNGLGSINEDKNEISVLLGNSWYSGRVRLENLDETNIGDLVRVKIESVTFQGLGGTVYSPVTVSEYNAKVSSGNLSIKINDMDADTVYHITVTAADGDRERFDNKNVPVRYEFERGTLLGKSYTYDSAYATTGEVSGMVGGIEQPGDGVELKFSVPEEGDYQLDIIFGKANDGSSPTQRVGADALMSIDGNETVLRLPNTIKSEYTSKMTVTASLEKGGHTLAFKHSNGTFVLDSVLVSMAEHREEISVLRDADSGGMLAVAPENGWYRVDTGAKSVRVDGTLAQGNVVYLRRGLNLIKIGGETGVCGITKTPVTGDFITVLPGNMTLSDGARTENGALTGITAASGRAEFEVDVQNSGDYRITLTYSNNEEGGYHAYNVDLIEEYVTVEVNGQKQNVWCRNTCSDENRSTVTFNVRLEEGKNKFMLYNDGSVAFADKTPVAPEIYALTVNPAAWRK